MFLFLLSLLMNAQEVNSEFHLDTTTWPNGRHTIEVRAYDAAGNMGFDAITVQVENTFLLNIPAHGQIDDSTLTWHYLSDRPFVGVDAFVVRRDERIMPILIRVTR